jgi:acetyltransferase-like isoleucine patch superfamily enzyme
MKTGLGLYRKYRMNVAYLNLFRFWLRKTLLGFDVANLFLQRVDKHSLLLILRKNGAKIGKDCDLETGLVFHNCQNYSNLEIGNYCHIGKECFFDLRNKILILDNVVISMRCTFVTHLDVGRSELNKIYPSESSPIHISSNCYLGAGALVLMGVTIHNRSVVAAGSIVTKDVPPNVLAGGAPARKIKDLV